MSIAEAIYLITKGGIQAKFVPTDDEACDDSIMLNGNENIAVQVMATRDGLRFCAAFYEGEGDDFCVTHGQVTKDPVAAAREAVALALA